MIASCFLCKVNNFSLENTVRTADILPRLTSDWGVEKITGQAFNSLCKNEKIEHLVCQNCDVGTWNPMISGDEEFYDSISSTYVDYRWDKAVVRSLISEVDSILDVGSGPTPIFENFSVSKLSNFAVIDQNPHVIEKLKPKDYAVYGDPGQVAVENKVFAAIVALHFLEHIIDPLSYFMDLKDLLSEDGSIWISTPNRYRSFKHNYFEPLDVPPHHVTTWTTRALANFTGALDMKIEEIWVSTPRGMNIFSKVWFRFFNRSEFRKIRKIHTCIDKPKKIRGYQILIRITKR
jgi:SAM-dependent methyltransferase